MTELQRDLFEAPTHPRVRAFDPTTSHAAAAEVERTGRARAQMSRCLDAVSAHPGLTSRELASRIRIDRYIVARRLPELERDGKVRKGAIRVCAKGNRSAVTWWPL